MAGGICSRTLFFLKLVSYWTFNLTHFYTFFLMFWLHLVPIKPMLPISPYKYHPKLTIFSHHTFFSPPHSFTFIVLVFFSYCGGQLSGKKGSRNGSKIDQPAWGTKRSILGVNVNLLLFIPVIFLPWVKRLFLGV